VTTELTETSAVDFLRAHGLVGDDEVRATRSLGGGVSNRVLQVETAADCYVLKQPLPNLAVEDDWPADVVRVHNEAAATRAYSRICETVPNAAVPSVLAESRDDHVVAFSCAPDDAVMWKRDLLDGRVDVRVAETVGRILGAVHADAAGDDELRAAFADETPFLQLRIEPYHRTTAERHPDVADPIEEEVERILGVQRTLVHGDYSPKNVLVAPGETDGNDGGPHGGDPDDGTPDDGGPADGAADDGDGDGTPEAWILDSEVAHWGDPAFDTAFVLNHLFIKSVYNHERMAAYHEAARAFWTVYDERVPWDVERETVRELAILMLARVDGKSPVEYVEREAVADALRSVAEHALTADVATLEGFRDTVAREVEAL
jgi:5-methylthioribose kinase